ncbi:hypothetical protein CHH83_25670 [Bacillus sp. 7586-K]|nr:hypothetical protein CHH83_25670 [Bacillus sp. 7586-K]
MSDPLNMMNDFFRSRPKRTLLDSIDDMFKQQSPSFLVNINETDEQYTVIAELPGVPKNDIHVEMRGNDLIINVTEQKQPPRNLGGVRRVHIPEHVLKKKMKAVYRNGLLEISFRKRRPTRIEIE